MIYLSDQDNENYANSYLGNEIQWKNDSNYEIEWSPSGKEIFLGCSSAIRCAGYLYFIETGEDQVLADFLQCKWSPKGTQLFCIIPKESNGFISENVLGFLDINSGNMSEIESTRTFYPTSYTSILWSPDGKNIGESSYFMDVVGGPTSFLLNPDMLVQTDLGETTLLDWSPDSQRMLGKDINQSISIIDIISKNKTYLTDGVEAVWQPKPYSRINANVESLPPIETLNVKPGDNKGGVRLEWTAPVVNNKNSGQYYYDIRSSESPLEEKNWEIGMKYQNKVSVSPELNSIIWNNQPLAQVRFYGIRIVDQKGNPVSSISNIVSFIDSGFRANVNGYSFRNGPWDDPDTPEKKDVTGWSEKSENDFSYDDICNMLGDPNLCSNVTFRPWVDLIKNEMYSLQGGGQCAGMSSTSAYFSYLDKNPLLPSPESSVYQGVKLNDVRKVIALESFKQFTSPTFDWITTQLGTSTTKDTISTIGLAFIKKDPIILSMYPAKKYPHAVTPVAMTGMETANLFYGYMTITLL